MLEKLDDADFLAAFHGWSTVFWIPFTGLAYGLGWLESVTFVSLISMMALFLGSFSAWAGARGEKAVERLEGELVD
jgi:hypothetical protein